MVRDWISKPLTVALGMGLCFGLASNASAQNFIRQRPTYCPCPPGHIQTLPSTTSPSTTSPSSPSSPSTPSDPSAPTTPMDPAAPMADPNAAQNQPAPNAPSTDFNQAATASTGDAGPMSSAGSTPFAGRLDSNNRFNLFDNMTAIPQTRAWVGYMYTAGTNNDVNVTDDGKFLLSQLHGSSSSLIDQYTKDLDLTKKHGQNTYRFGFELLICEDFSIAAMGQYVDPTDGGAQANFTNPQFMLKYVVARDENFVLSATFGYQPEISKGKKEIGDLTSRYYPGAITYVQLTDDLFMQGSGQFGLPQSGDLYTADWGVSFGYWLYRHESLDSRFFGGRSSGDGPILRGIVPQVEFFGHHVLGDTTQPGLGGVSSSPIGDIDGSGIGGGPLPYLSQPFFLGEEPRHIFDATVAVQWILHHNLVLSTGVSFPLSGQDNSARKAEYLATLNCYF